MYVPGTLYDVDKILCDLGTSYFVEKTQKETTGFLNRKQEMMKTSIETYSKNLTEKTKIHQQLVAALTEKAQMIRQQQSEEAAKANPENKSK
eukprot:UN16290